VGYRLSVEFEMIEEERYRRTPEILLRDMSREKAQNIRIKFDRFSSFLSGLYGHAFEKILKNPQKNGNLFKIASRVL